MNDRLDEERNSAADAEFGSFVFDEGCEPEATDGWERVVTGDEWTRTLYFPPAEGEEGPTVKGHFTVVFETGSATVRSAWASLNGNDVGHRADRAPAP